jgi:hypothetical protein
MKTYRLDRVAADAGAEERRRPSLSLPARRTLAFGLCVLLFAGAASLLRGAAESPQGVARRFLGALRAHDGPALFALLDPLSKEALTPEMLPGLLTALPSDPPAALRTRRRGHPHQNGLVLDRNRYHLLVTIEAPDLRDRRFSVTLARPSRDAAWRVQFAPTWRSLYLALHPSEADRRLWNALAAAGAQPEYLDILPHPLSAHSP